MTRPVLSVSDLTLTEGTIGLNTTAAVVILPYALARWGAGREVDIVDAAGGSREAFQLLMVDQIPVLAESAAKAISNIKFDKVVVWDGGNGSGAHGFLQNMGKTLPPMMQVLRDIAGVELPGVFGVFYYRSANRKTLDILSRFLPVPVEGLAERLLRSLSLRSWALMERLWAARPTARP